MAAATELATIACILATCQELALPRASYYRNFIPVLREGTYHCSISTMYRVLDEHDESHERRNQLLHPPYQKSELMTTAPNQLWKQKTH
jgi:hypothetical protein